MNGGLAFLERSFWGATIGDYLAFVAFLIAGILLRKPLAKGIAYITGRLIVQQHVAQNRPLFQSLMRKPLQGLILTLFLFIAFNFIEGPMSETALLHWKRKDGEPGLTVSELIGHLFSFAAIIYIALLISHILEFVFLVMMEHARENGEREREQLLPLLRDITKILLWTIAVFSLLGIVFHVNIPALITGLGIGGVALALAAKESIENLLASFTILADKPCVLGDTIRIGSNEGKVERIGFRSTRIRDKEGILLVVPNKKLVDEYLQNLTGRDRRRFKLILPLRYNLDQVRLDQLIESIRQLMKSRPELEGEAEITIASYEEKAMKLQVLYHLPEEYSDAQVQIFKDTLNKDLYSAILPAMTISRSEIEEDEPQ